MIQSGRRHDVLVIGANIPGKPRVFMPYAAKIGVYRRECQEVVDRGYEEFVMKEAPHARV